MDTWCDCESGKLVVGHCWRLANLQYVPQAPREVDMVRDGEDEGKKRTSTGEWKWAS